MLELRGVWKRYAGIPVVEDVNFCARPGEVTGYLGPNGSGKSTTMKMIAGLIEASFGTILFEGPKSLRRWRDERGSRWLRCGCGRGGLRRRISCC